MVLSGGVWAEGSSRGYTLSPLRTIPPTPPPDSPLPTDRSEGRMFFLFGWGQRSIYDEGPTLSTRCQNCNNHVWLRLNTSKTWFTIFLIPVIPYKLTNWLECPVCSRGV